MVSVEVAEQQQANEAPRDYVIRLATTKASAGYQLHPGHVVMGADTIVVLGDKVLEKPRDKLHAVKMLQVLSGATHEVMTAVCLCREGESRTLCNTTQVSFREISVQEAEHYWQTGEPADKAGGYGIQGYGGIFVERILGSYSCVVGLPLFETSQLLAQFGVPIWHTEENNNCYE